MNLDRLGSNRDYQQFVQQYTNCFFQVFPKKCYAEGPLLLLDTLCELEEEPAPNPERFIERLSDCIKKKGDAQANWMVELAEQIAGETAENDCWEGGE
ncbi:hypothetical protein [Pseudobacillus badius]|uniref:hypothetical protein n=1 Tax=Bacillus badius TaxID=1455 RepID=UPI000597C2F8|nr:hypothetical protein [Bacillus badius]KIL74690.1 hypothetical protein SD78_1759 [Bacillus badius]UAT32442.1 hypothetical protein K7T73_09635 [Bacillus badius]GLY12721.1 hypothetical protein Bbad01_39370 [Bacillus badius]